MTSEPQLSCAACAAPLAAGDRFCEQCGARSSDEEPAGPGCQACGAPAEALDDEGYCTICGVRERPASNRVELDLVIAAAVSDQGRVHRRNEDAFALGVAGERSVAVVVCDGISSASAGDSAAQSAAAAARETLATAIDAGRDRRDAIGDAIQAAHEAVERVEWTARADRDMPSCTLVAALWHEGEIAIGWLGDSRAYWVAAGDIRQLTTDDSWAEEQIAEGLLTREQASRDPRFHSITHWVGADAPERPPRVVVIRPDRPGRLVLCTDGLWNYAPSPGELGTLVDALPEQAAPAAVARSLTETALARGGRDNITVAVVDVGVE
jgi:serine/threonine protein phosphatase PrpC